jgi:hypothetical protein
MVEKHGIAQIRSKNKLILNPQVITRRIVTSEHNRVFIRTCACRIMTPRRWWLPFVRILI